ncbi:MAG: biopolymer transporter ExbD [Verrucomicrobiota bacterium]
MKLESTLEDRAGMLYTAPLTDTVLLLLIFFLFGSNFVLKSGFEVNLPTSGSALPAAEDAHIISLVTGEENEFFFDDERISVDQLAAKLDDVSSESKEVILLGDISVNYGNVMEISKIILSKGFELSFATQQDLR